jgi:vancomycin resistance protein YoaR
LTNQRDHDQRKRGPAKRRTRRPKLSLTQFRALLITGVLVAILLLAILVDAGVYYNKVHSGVRVSEQNLGGLTRDEATALLERFVKEAGKRPITLTSGSKTWDVLPADVGTEIDVEGAVSAAMGYTRDSNFFVDVARRLKLYFDETDVPLLGTVDSEKMDAVLALVAEEIDVPPIDAGLKVVDGELQVIEAESGKVVDRDALREQLKGLLFTLHAADLEVPLIVKEPSVVAEDNEAAKGQAETMYSSSLKLTSGEHTWTLSPEKIAAYLDFRAEDQGGVSTLVPYLSPEKMTSFFEEVSGVVGTKAKNATWKSDGTQAWVVDGVQGKALDAEKTAEALTVAALETAGRSAEAVLKTTDPDRTTEEAKAMGIKDRLGTCKTTYGGTPNRQQNVRKATEYVSDELLAPGEEFNFIDTIGPRTAARGFLTAPGIVGPGKLEDVFGGGICQVSTTLFNAALEAGLKITERRNHSIYISHYPKGRDATVSDVSPNLRFVNDTGSYILIRGSSDGVVTIFSIYGTSDGRTVDIKTGEFYDIVTRGSVTTKDPTLGVGTTLIKTEGQDGQRCLVTRTITWPDGRKKVDKFGSTWLPIDKQIAVGTATTTATTTVTTLPSTTTTATSELTTTTSAP